MAISNISSGSRPGVCTSTTRPQNPYEGFLIYETDTNRVLIWDNSAWVMIADTDQPPASQVVASQTFSAVTQVDFIDVFTSDFTSYQVLIHDYSSTVSNEMLIRLRSSSGVVDTANYDSNRLESTGTAPSDAKNNFNFVASTSWSWSYLPASTTTGAGVSGLATIYRPNETAYTRYTVQTSRHDNVTGTMYNVTGNGLFRLTTQMTGISFIRTSTSTISGKITIIGLRG